MFKSALKKCLQKLGIEVARWPRRPPQGAAAGSASRPVGDLRSFLEDLKARQFKPRGIVDVGANFGHWTKCALSIWPDSKVLMVEPLQETRAALEELVAKNPNLELVCAGVGRESGELVQTIWKDLVGSSFLPNERPEYRLEGLQRTTPVITLDALLNERSDFAPDLVKMDIQGFELEALRGGASLFGVVEVFILETWLYQFMERSPLAVEVINFMNERNYAIYDIVEYLRRPSDGALGQVDIAFARVDGCLRQSVAWLPGDTGEHPPGMFN